MIIDESKTNATNTHEENTEVTDAANTTEQLIRKTTNDADEAKTIHEKTSTAENPNNIQHAISAATMADEATAETTNTSASITTKDDTAVPKTTKSLKVTGNTSKCGKSH